MNEGHWEPGSVGDLCELVALEKTVCSAWRFGLNNAAHTLTK